MRLSLRFIIPLLLALTAIAYAVVPLVDQLTLRWFVRDMDIRSRLIANTIEVAGDGIITINYDGRFPAPGNRVFLVE